ncbi:unnamed protein product [Darwinula stevensoni]|uniref:receptor protein-tyrosine kinase n=1 Tax=Darwinula stevensoni TaxID=69355 RepID=A0A7R9A7V1_9CRUS|nr:unnamed protein product [Darwinula stevensoni]CAG0895157.1 unnamed protein product [Darwinula stevensoni]
MKAAALVVNSSTFPVLGNELQTPIIEGIATVTKGSQLTLNCSVSGHENGNLELEWIFQIPEHNGRIEQKVFRSGRHMNRLVVRNVTSKDEGIYTCRATSLKSTKEAHINVIVQEGHVHVTPKEAWGFAYLGEENVEWKLKVDAEPTPNFVLKHNEFEMSQNGEIFTIEVKPTGEMTVQFKYIDTEAYGNYTLVVGAGIKKEKAILYLNPRRPYDIVQVTLASIAVFLLVVVTGITIYYNRVGKGRVLHMLLTKVQVKWFHEGQLGNINPALDLGQKAYYLPYEDRWEFPADKLILGEVIGRGEYGVVVKAVAIGILDSEMETPVAVKMSKPDSDPIHYKALITELKIMSHLGNNQNIVNLLGACTRDIAHGNLMIVMEYCPNGSLERYLRQHQNHYIDMIDHQTGRISRSLPRGPQGDGPDRGGDEGYVIIAMDSDVNDNNGSLGQAIKWMALESLTKDKVYTCRSDVWAFGVTMWEVFSLGNHPYPNIERPETLIKYLEDGNRMESPAYANDKL